MFVKPEQKIPVHKEGQPNLEVRHIVTLGLIFAALAVLAVRLWVLQVVRHEELVEKAEVVRQAVIPKPAPRGLIVDRKGRLLAGVRPQVVVTVVPDAARRNPWIVDKLASMLGASPQKIRERIEQGAWRRYLPTPVFVGASVPVATRIAEAGPHLPGVGVETQPMRYYPDSKSFSHILGYVWTPDSRDVERLEELGLKAPEYVGKLGVEYHYERELMGVEGRERVEVDVRRRPVRVLGRDNPVPGSRLTLGIDADLQRRALELLGSRRGAVVMLDPSSGEVLCLASSPTYDVRLFEGGISREDYRRLQEDRRAPLLNRAIRGFYSPGSTFKIVTSMAARRAGVFSNTRPVACRGYFQIGRRRLRCLGVHGAIAFPNAMAKSCNTYFASLGMDAGPDALIELALEAGLGQKTGIDLRGEGAGIVPTREWMATHRDPPRWYGGDTANMAIGQGFLSLTPLQMAQLIALVANRGVAYRPHLVRRITEPGAGGATRSVEPEATHRVDADPAFWEALVGSLRGVVEAGTAVSARIPGIAWCGKTGSTEHVRGRKTHGWFVGFAPMDRPMVAIAVLVEESGHGGEVAAPIARELVAAYLLGRPSAAAAKDEASSSADTASAVRPAVR
ncbi:MAG: penicillin-binding protein 2 [Fimbriimonadales bacterium]|nr:penicillin-binding protein 2 [Fimbriimonadales bacterium]